MNIYIAGGEGEMKRFSRNAKGAYNGETFKGTNILQSFYYADDDFTGTLVRNCSNFLLDSGAFTFMNATKTGGVDFDSYCDRYIDFINAHDVEQFFELDIDSVAGYEKVLQLRKRIERRTGKQPIVVWHKSRGKQAFIDSCKEYPYVALGGIVTKEITQKDYKHFPWFIDKAHEHGAKIHALGLTALASLPKYHFDSVDSTAWVSGNRFGGIYVFNGKTMVKHNKPEGQRIGSHKAVAMHNFREWVKFQEYARINY